jgi:hypothetical protein
MQDTDTNTVVESKFDFDSISSDKLQYFSSLDHLKWYMPDHLMESEIYLSKDLLDSYGRYKIRQWIEENCRSTIYMWNGCQMPAANQDSWGHLVSPAGDGRFYFADKFDRVLFLLTWKSYNEQSYDS